jgi:hypothetical protein
VVLAVQTLAVVEVVVVLFMEKHLWSHSPIQLLLELEEFQHKMLEETDKTLQLWV